MHQLPMFTQPIFKNKTIIVTGGGSGLGKSMSAYLYSLGANVVLTSRTLEKLEAAKKDIEELFPNQDNNILAIAGDVRNIDDVKQVIDHSIDTFGEINGLINNAAGNFISPTEKLSHRAFESVIGIVLQGSINYTLTLGKHWIERKQPGTVLNITTTYASTGSGYVVPSACAKAGVLAMTRSLAVEWAKYSIRMNAIAPGPFPTKGAWDRLFPKSLQESFQMEKRIPVGRVGLHQELANLAAYLLSDFSAFVNGEVVTIDGGEWLQGAGEFNFLNQLPSEVWDSIEKQIREAKRSK